MTPVPVETDVGTLLLPAHDDVVRPWMAHYGCWEPEEAALIRERAPAGGHVVDLGAHVGYHSLVAAAAVGPAGTVTAVEASRANVRLLRANVRDVPQVRVVHAAAWDRSGRVSLSGEAGNSGDQRATRCRWPRGVRAVRVDDLVAGARVDLVKSDLQGRDHLALRGMTWTLSRWRPVVVTEFWPHGIRDVGDDPYDVLDEYRALGGTICSLDGVTGDFVAAADAAESGFLTLVLSL
ncbi:MAG TPA: FkbM family methyltransferase [Frankiaceae bacterium]|nr:FkbM family methyltransferase [Frankiaceae bacterium]